MRRVIAVDLGGTQLRVGVVDEAGQPGFHSAQPTRAKDGPAAVLGQIEAMVAKARAAAPDALPVIGVAAPGPLDTKTGVVCTAQTLSGFDGYPLRAELQARLGVPVALDNDGIAGAIGEWRFGAGRGTADLLYVTLSTGIGGGIIAGNRPLRGKRGLAGHIGHIFFSADWPRAPGGTMTCFEDYASATALAWRARQEVLLNPGSSLAHVPQIDAAAVVSAAAAGDPLASRLLAEEARLVGIGLASLIHVLNPERIVLGGGLSLALPVLGPGIQKAMLAHAKPGFDAVDLVAAGLGPHSCLCGAAAIALFPDLGP